MLKAISNFSLEDLLKCGAKLADAQMIQMLNMINIQNKMKQILQSASSII